MLFLYRYFCLSLKAMLLMLQIWYCCIFTALYFALLLLLILVYFRVAQIHCFSIVCPSFIDVCIVLFCFALLCSPPLHPPFSVFRCPACIWGLVFSAVPVPPPPGVNIEEHIQIRQEEKRQRINRRHRLEEGRGMDQGDGGNIFGLCRFGFMAKVKWVWVKMTQQDRRLNILCPSHFFPPALITSRCCLSWVLGLGFCSLASVLVFFCVCFLV